MRLYIFAAGSISRSARPVMKSTAYFFPFRVQVIMGLTLPLSDMCSVSLTDGGQFIQRWLEEAERIA